MPLWDVSCKTVRLSWFLLLVLGPAFHNGSVPLFAEEEATAQENATAKPLSEKQIHQIWNKIKTSSQSESPTAPDDVEKYWRRVCTTGRDELRKIVVSSNPRKGLSYFVDQFGKGDAETDMHWLLAARSLGLTPNQSVHPAEKEKQQQLRRAQMIFAELQVRQFLKNPELLARYYQAINWYDQMFSDQYFPDCFELIYENMRKDKPGEEYWWSAQNYLLVMHALHSEELWHGSDPKKVFPTFPNWRKWMRQKFVFLRASPDIWYWIVDEGEKSREEAYVPLVLQTHLPPLKVRPETPFPDWNGHRLLSAEQFRELELSLQQKMPKEKTE